MSKNIIRIIGVSWAVLGITILLGSALWRVSPHAVSAISSGLIWWQWVILIIWCVFMIKSEGIDGFQKRFAPRVADRLTLLLNRPSVIDIVLAPLFCMSYYRAPRRRIITSFSVTIGVVVLILLVHQVTQPWRGIIDSGVVLGIGYGLISVYIYVTRAIYNFYNTSTS